MHIPPFRLIPFSLALFLAGACGAAAEPACPAPKTMDFQVEQKIYRNVLGFTEGLEMHNHDLYESTGPLGGDTRLMRITPQGQVTVLNDSGQKYFGEGLTFLGNNLYQLSWRDHEVFVYDLNAKLVRTMHNPYEGWGMTNDGHFLIFGDGSEHLYFAAPNDFSIKKTITVRHGDYAMNNINELEYVGGKIYANVWMTRQIERINPTTGCIEGEAYMDPLWQRMTADERDYVGSNDDFVLNGIAYDPQAKLFYLTGKEWPFLFTGRFVDR